MEISVIINCHNSEKYIKKTIISVLDQTYKDFELIIFDNNSKDSTKEIVETFKDSRIKYFSTVTKYNLGKARELAVKNAKNCWISFIDSDDLWLSNKLYEQVEYIKKNSEVGLVYTDYIYINEHDIELKKKSYTEYYKSLTIEKLIKKNFICFSSIIFNKEKIRSNNTFNKILKNSEDFDLILKIAKYESLGFIKKKLVKYRLHQNNLTKFQTKRSYSEWQYLVYKYSKNHLEIKKMIKKKYKFENLKNKFKKILKYH